MNPKPSLERSHTGETEGFFTFLMVSVFKCSYVDLLFPSVLYCKMEAL